jgi:hypothetical protein
LSDPEPPKSKDAKVSETETVDRRPARVVSGPAGHPPPRGTGSRHPGPASHRRRSPPRQRQTHA